MANHDDLKKNKESIFDRRSPEDFSEVERDKDYVRTSKDEPMLEGLMEALTDKEIGDEDDKGKNDTRRKPE